MDKALTIKLTDHLADLLTKHSQDLEITKGELIRKSLDHYLQHLIVVAEASESIEKFAKNPTVETIFIEAIKHYAKAQKIIQKELRELEQRSESQTEKTIRKLGGEG